MMNQLEVNPTSSFIDFAVRNGTRPTTSPHLPHVQLDQLPAAEIARQLFQKVQELDFVGVGQSAMASSRVDAAWVAPEEARGPREAFLNDAEFCHVHTAGGGFCHLTLPSNVSKTVVENGWAELHLLAQAKTIPETVHLVYAPRNATELETVLRIVTASRDFARGVSSGAQSGA